jgi:hypothetical protein
MFVCMAVNLKCGRLFRWENTGFTSVDKTASRNLAILLVEDTSVLGHKHDEYLINFLYSQGVGKLN